MKIRTFLSLLFLMLISISSCNLDQKESQDIAKQSSIIEDKAIIVNTGKTTPSNQADPLGVSVTEELMMPLFSDNTRGLSPEDGIYEGIAIEGGVDFQSLKNYNNSIYYRDKNNIFIQSIKLRKIEWVNEKDFKVILPYEGFKGLSAFGTDGSNIIFHGERVVNGDIETLRFNKEGEAGDKNNLYLGTTILEKGDIHTLKRISNVCHKDRQRVYCMFKEYGFAPYEVIEGADSETFKEIKYPWYKDKISIYHAGIKVEGVDSATFEILGELGNYAKDKNHVYYKNKMIDGLNPQKAILITKPAETGYGESYIKDDKNVYKDGELQGGINPSDIN